MKTWKVESAGESWQVDAPDDVTEGEVNEFAAANYASWVNGGHYRMDPVSEPSPRNVAADSKVKAIDTRLAEIEAEQGTLGTREFVETPGGAVTGFGQKRETPALLQRSRELKTEADALKDERSRNVVGDTGQTVGGVGGALTGAGLGAALGSPLGPPGMAVGGTIGAILGGTAGTAAGTHLYDIPQARKARDINDAEAAEIIKSRAIESLIWDGEFVLILGPGGRVIGKIADGAKFLPALKAAAKESVAWDQLPKAKSQQMEKVIGQRAAAAPEGLATEASRTLQVTPRQSGQVLTTEALRDIAERTGGRVPTRGEITGMPGGLERFARGSVPARFFENDQKIAKAAVDIRDEALGILDDTGAYVGADLGNAIRTVTKSANNALKRTTGRVFERAAKADVLADMAPTIKILENVLARDQRSMNRLLAPAERASLDSMLTALQVSPNMWVDGVQDFISGNKAALRGLSSEGAKPTEFMEKVLNDVVQAADGAYLAALQKAPDAALKADLLAARKLYGETMRDLYSDTMVKVARQTPEDVGRMLTAKGSVTEIREIRAALDRALSLAPAKPHMRGKIVAELGKQQAVDERARIDAGIIKGFIEKQTLSLDSLSDKLRDPDFRLTLKELLTGKGIAEPERGRVVLERLDRILATEKLAPPPIKRPRGISVSPTTVVAGATPLSAGGAAMSVVSGALGLRHLASSIATYMTTGNDGYFRAIERAVVLSRLAGKSAAAAEAARAAARDLEMWDQQEGQ